MSDVTTPAPKLPVGQTLLERVAMPAMFIGIGWALGFFHGRASKKSSG